MRKKMNLNDFSKWLQYNKEWKIEYFPYPLYFEKIQLGEHLATT